VTYSTQLSPVFTPEELTLYPALCPAPCPLLPHSTPVIYCDITVDYTGRRELGPMSESRKFDPKELAKFNDQARPEYPDLAMKRFK
jgi:hypothetical protein